MLLRKSFCAAVGCLMACTMSFAGEPVAPNPLRVPGTLNLHQEKVLNLLKQNEKAIVSNPASVKKIQQLRGQVGNTPKSFVPAAKGTPRMTRASEFGAYYTLPNGVYTIKPGFQMGQDLAGNPEYTRFGILAPMMEDVTYTNASTGASSFDWYINGMVTDENKEQLHAIYVPYGSDWWTPMPELTAYDEEGNDSIYQYGYGFDYQVEDYIQGQAVTTGWGFVHNMNLFSESWSESLPLSSTGSWSRMMFGSDTLFAPQYFEYFEKPLSPIVLNAVYLNIATPANTDLSMQDFGVTLLQPGNYGWAPTSARVSAKPVSQGIIPIEGYSEFGWWVVLVSFEKPILVDDEFMLLLDGPQNKTVPWAFLFDLTRQAGERNTCGFIPTKVPEGMSTDYIGSMVSYTGQDNAGNMVEFSTSLDLGLYTYMPYNIFFDAASGYPIHSVNNDTLQIGGADALNASVILWNWEALNIGKAAKLEISSDSEWLSAEITRPLSDSLVTYEITFKAEPCPDVQGERFGTITFTDGQGYSSKLTFHQLSATSIEGLRPSESPRTELDPEKPIYDLTGRLVRNPAPGIYIQEGRKFVVK